MKRIVLVLVLTFSVGAIAQSPTKEDIDIVQSVYGKSKKEIVDNYMALSGEKLEAFKKVYDKYEDERKALGREKVQVVDNYAKNYMTLTDAQADEISKALLKNNMSYQKLYSNYYGKFKKAIGAMDAAKLLQLEIYLQTTIQAEIQDAVPFIGEIDRTKKSQN